MFNETDLETGNYEINKSRKKNHCHKSHICLMRKLRKTYSTLRQLLPWRRDPCIIR